MPCNFQYSDNRWKIRQRAEQQVAKKFPNLIVGSTGWWRAVANRFKRML